RDRRGDRRAAPVAVQRRRQDRDRDHPRSAGRRGGAAGRATPRRDARGGSIAALADTQPRTRPDAVVGPDIRYVRSSGSRIAYQVLGDGDTDLVFVSSYGSNLVYAWESEYWRPLYERLAQSFRLILFDKRGSGLSDRGGSFPTLETRMEDVHAVMKAVNSER